MALKPTWEVYLRLGEQYGRELEPIHTFDAIAADLGTTRQRIYHETYVALGKLVYALRKQLASDIANYNGK
jgi:hypothetical protein